MAAPPWRDPSPRTSAPKIPAASLPSPRKTPPHDPSIPISTATMAPHSSPSYSHRAIHQTTCASPSQKTKNVKLKKAGSEGPRRVRFAPVPVAKSTLMEAQEFGEMMEHVDEVNFALEGLRKGQPVRIRRASLLSLLSICATAQQRRLLRAQGMAKRIIDAVVSLSFDDSPSTVAAAALFYVLASDAQDDHLLDSSSCIRFLLKLLDPPIADAIENKTPTIGSRLLGICSNKKRRLDSSSTAIISKVQDILLSCKEIKSSNGDDDGMGRPELSSKWIALLIMEKACLSTVSFEDTSGIMRRVGGNFKERLKDFGGLDAIFDVASSCHCTLEGWLRKGLPSAWELKDGAALHSVVLLLKCLKIMENATFLSRDNQNHLLGMKAKLDSEGSPLSFVGLVICAIKTISDLSLLHSSSSIPSNDKTNCPFESVDAHFSHASEVQLKESSKDDCDETSSIDSAGCCGTGRPSNVKNFKVCQKRQRLSPSESEIFTSGLGITVASGAEDCSINKRADFPSISCNGAFMARFSINANGSKMSSKRGANRWTSINANCSKMDSVSGSNGRLSINTSGSKMTSVGLGKRRNACEDIKDDMRDSYDPFMFDEDELKPSKWEMLATRKETSETRQSTLTDKELVDGCEFLLINSNSQTINGENHQSCENSFPSLVEEDSNLLEDCLLTAVKVLMNLTNDNPVGCQQIANCGGLDTMASLIISHFPSFDSFLSMCGQLEVNISFSKPISDAGHMNNKHLSDHKLDFLVAILGLLVNLVEKDSRNRSWLASASVPVARSGRSEGKESHRDVIPLLCSIFLANQGAGEASGEGRSSPCNDEAALLEGEREAEMMIIEAYAALLLAFLSTESKNVRDAIACCLPTRKLEVLVPVLERFVEFHLSLNMISPETHLAVCEVIESCKGP